MSIEKRAFAKSIPINSIIMRWQGVFDYDGLYKFIQSWLANRHYEFHEKAYKRKPAELGEEVELSWFAEKKVTGYVMNRFDVEMHFWDLNDTEMDGKKMTEGRFWINMSAKLVLDYEQKWGKTRFYHDLREFFHKHIFKKQIEFKWGEDLRLELNKLFEDVKAYLEAMAKGKVY